ncbi:PAS domain S-box protein [Chitinophaga filiformis]|uniref:histidine kinase n=1 Tax=Chitinophaga filiformis TaxID=104663 RepID=A0A1G7TQ34_CHIFI|nr:PAS domain S-box protein [Chitinophaga filiformis]SDG37443.1 PAS domain S-box-containing protein [Chitinophaga filiformis]
MDRGFNTTISNAFLTDAGISQLDILQLLPVAACIYNASGKMIFYNEAAAKLWGRRPTVIQAGDIYDAASPCYTVEGIYLSHDAATLAALIKEGTPCDDWQVILERPDKSKILLKGTLLPLKDKSGVTTAVLHCFQEVMGTTAALREIDEHITRYTQLNEELKRSEERHHKLIEEVEDYAILLLDKSGIIQNWNKGAEKIKGYRESEIVGKHFSVFYLPEDRERHLPETMIAKAKETGKAVQEGWRVRKDGSRFWGSIVITALHDAEHNVIGFSKVTRDLTEKKLWEDKIRQYANELEFQNKELEQFAYAAAHDMKEPLRKIQFYNNYIFDNSGLQLPDKAREYLTRSISAASRMRGLIDDLLTYSQASSFSQEMVETDLNVLISEAISSHHDIIEKNNVLIEVDQFPVMRVIPFQFAQLFDNLLGNALKYRHPDRQLHITIRAEKTAAPPEARNAGFAELCYYRFSIADNGIGFESDYADKLFELFQRLHSQPGVTGSGIGLAICKKIVLNHHGLIKAYGNPGHGARFDIYVPCE